MRTLFSILLFLTTLFIIGMSYLDTWLTADALEEHIKFKLSQASTAGNQVTVKLLEQQSWRKVGIFGIPLITLNVIWWKLRKDETKVVQRE